MRQKEYDDKVVEQSVQTLILDMDFEVLFCSSTFAVWYKIQKFLKYATGSKSINYVSKKVITNHQIFLL